MDLHGYLIVGGCFLSSMIAVGMPTSFGNMFKDVMDTFHVSRSQVGSVHSTQFAVGLGAGLFSGLLVQRFGTLKIGLLGASCVSIGVTTSYFATSISYLIVTFGILTAFGMSCIIVCSVTVPGKYYNGRKAVLAVSLVQTGAGVGGVFFPYLLRALADKYGFHGTMLIIGGVCLNLIPISSLWRNQPTKPVTKYRQPSKANHRESNASRHSHLPILYKEVTYRDGIDKGNTEDDCDVVIADNIKHDAFTGSPVNIPLKDNDTKLYPHTNESKETNEVTNDIDLPYNNNKYTDDPVVPKVVFDTPPKTSSPKRMPLLQAIRTVVSNPPFICYTIGIALAFQTSVMVLVYIQDMFLDKGLSKQNASLAILLIQLCSILGRMLPGILFQFRFISTFTVPLLTETLVIVFVLLITFVDGVVPKILFSGCFGVPYGMHMSMLGAMALRFCDLSTVSTGVGVSMTLCGLSAAGFGPLNGYIRDKTGSYVNTVSLSTSIASIAIIFLLIGHFWRRRQKRRVWAMNVEQNNKVNQRF